LSSRKSSPPTLLGHLPLEGGGRIAKRSGRGSSGGRRPPRPSPFHGEGAESEAPPRQSSHPIDRSFFDRSVHAVAPELIGATLLFDGAGGPIVEVEAYHHTDPAAHSFGGRTARNAVMFGPPGHAYVYRSYGIHWCLNFVCEAEGSASAVLIRALAPVAGLDSMRRRRGLEDPRLLCSGPGRLCQALGITMAHNGAALDRAPFELRLPSETWEIVVGPRIGITKAADRPWRYGARSSYYLSKPFPQRTTVTKRP